MSVTQCCRQLGCDQAILRALLMTGRIPYIRKRGKLLIKVSDLDRYMEDARGSAARGH